MPPQTNREKLLDKSKNPFGSFWELCDEITELTAGHYLRGVTLRESLLGGIPNWRITYSEYEYVINKKDAMKNRHLNMVSIQYMYIYLKLGPLSKWASNWLAQILKAFHQ